MTFIDKCPPPVEDLKPVFNDILKERPEDIVHAGVDTLIPLTSRGARLIPLEDVGEGDLSLLPFNNHRSLQQCGIDAAVTCGHIQRDLICSRFFILMIGILFRGSVAVTEVPQPRIGEVGIAVEYHYLFIVHHIGGICIKDGRGILVDIHRSVAHGLPCHIGYRQLHYVAAGNIIGVNRILLVGILLVAKIPCIALRVLAFVLEVNSEGRTA